MCIWISICCTSIIFALYTQMHFGLQETHVIGCFLSANVAVYYHSVRVQLGGESWVIAPNRAHGARTVHPFPPNPLFLDAPFPVGDMDRPFFSWGYGLAPFRLRIPTRRHLCFHVWHQRVFGSGLASKRCLCSQILTMLYKKFAGLQVESFQPLPPFSINYDTFHGLHAHQFHWWHMECSAVEF